MADSIEVYRCTKILGNPRISERQCKNNQLRSSKSINVELRVCRGCPGVVALFEPEEMDVSWCKPPRETRDSGRVKRPSRHQRTERITARLMDRDSGEKKW